MIASPPTRYRLDDLRRLGTALGAGLGVAAPRASALATHLLWFDAAGASPHGIATLPGWLDRIESGEIDPKAEGRVAPERPGVAVFDAGRGLPPLALEAAARIASEKARDVGVGVVRVRNIGPTGPAAPVAAGLAIGPFVALVAGPSAALSLALPTADGLPSIHDSRLAAGRGDDRPPQESWMAAFEPWISTLAGGDGWLVVALSVPAMESLTTFHERFAATARPARAIGGSFAPEAIKARNREAREVGVTLDPAAEATLRDRAGRANIPWPDSSPDGSTPRRSDGPAPG